MITDCWARKKNENILESNMPPINTWPQVVGRCLKKAWMQSSSTHTANQKSSLHDLCTAGFLPLNEGIDGSIHNNLLFGKSLLELIKANDWDLFQIGLCNVPARLQG